MINILTGPQGSGKSYEAVVYHIIPALERGRKVITNLPLNIDHFIAVYGHDIEDLIDIKEPTSKNPVPFKTIEDFGDNWRMEGKNPIGPLYVIDECHKPFRLGEVNKEVDEWFGENRHELSDVLLITQNYGKIWKNLRTSVQLHYRVRKNVALGSSNSYVRKVQDGVRGEAVNQNIRTYDPKYYPFYNSHTKSDQHAQEQIADDVKPIWKHWTFLLGIPLIFFGLYNFLTSPSLLSTPELKKNVIQTNSPIPAPVVVSSPPQISTDNQPQQQMQSKTKDDDKVEPNHPYYKLQMHIGGFIQSEDKKRFMYSILLSQNGQVFASITDKDLTNSGYKIESLGACSFKVTYKQFFDYITCDAPSISPVKDDQSKFAKN